jgi:hypothetical protein
MDAANGAARGREVAMLSLGKRAVALADRRRCRCVRGDRHSDRERSRAGSGLVFENAGEHALKGVPDPWRLYRVIDAA